MSRTRLTEHESRELIVECYTCGATPGLWCVTKSGRLSTYLHADRWYMAKVIAAREQS